MALSVSNTVTDSTGRELLTYGTEEFPAAFYLDDLDRVESPWHWHQEFELVYLEKGSEVVSAAGRSVQLREHEAVFINSGVLHMMEPTVPGSLQHAIVFHPYLLGEASSVYWRKYVGPLLHDTETGMVVFGSRETWEKETAAKIETAFQSGAFDAPGCEFTVRSCLSEVVYAVLSHRENTGASSSVSSRDIERIKIMLRYLEMHYSEQVTLEKIAESAGLSVSETLRCFHRTMNTTPVQYLIELRIRRAAELLVSTDMKISEAAGMCGFDDMSYFVRVFRRLKHCTPSHYRREHA